MKTLLLTSVLLFTSLVPAFASPIQDGIYGGMASWKSTSDAVGTYQIFTTISNGTMSSNYDFNGQKRNWTFTMRAGKNGRFDVLVDGKKLGEGYCYDVQCHYQLDESGLEETLTFDGDFLYKLGSKTVGGEKIMWQERLSKGSH